MEQLLLDLSLTIYFLVGAMTGHAMIAGLRG